MTHIFFYIYCRLVCIDIISKSYLNNLRHSFSKFQSNIFARKKVFVKNFRNNAAIIVCQLSSNFGKRTRQCIGYFLTSRLTQSSQLSVSLYVSLSPESSPYKSRNTASICTSVTEHQKNITENLSVQIKTSTVLTA